MRERGCARLRMRARSLKWGASYRQSRQEGSRDWLNYTSKRFAVLVAEQHYPNLSARTLADSVFRSFPTQCRTAAPQQLQSDWLAEEELIEVRSSQGYAGKFGSSMGDMVESRECGERGLGQRHVAVTLKLFPQVIVCP